MIWKFFSSLFVDLIDMIYPKLCLSCNETLAGSESVICTKCIYEIPKTNFHTCKYNSVFDLFYGKISIFSATAFFYFQKGSVYQNLMHQLKYKGHKEIGIELGKLFALDIQHATDYNKIDYIIPIPLHPSRQRKRGYNQSEMIAIGMAEILHAKVLNHAIIRNKATQTQTKKSKTERMENVKSIFEIKDKISFSGSHILLIDDVITTGSTLISCAEEIHKNVSCKLSIAALAIAKN